MKCAQHAAHRTCGYTVSQNVYHDNLRNFPCKLVFSFSLNSCFTACTQKQIFWCIFLTPFLKLRFSLTWYRYFLTFPPDFCLVWNVPDCWTLCININVLTRSWISRPISAKTMREETDVLAVSEQSWLRHVYKHILCKDCEKLLWFIVLTHWDWDKRAAILQTFSSAFSWIKMYKFRFTFNLFLKVK